MKRIFSMVVMAVLAASLVPVVHAADCSNATLRGTYTLQASGFYKACKSCKTVPSAIAGIGTFDGAGNFTDLYTQSIDGQVVRNVTDHGTYTVNPDCTGSFEEASGAAEGEARITVPLVNTTPDNRESPKQHTFVVTIRVAPARRNSPGLRASLTPDQANTGPWKNAWTNLRNARQDFVPSLPRLTAVEVELVVANPGPESDEVTLGVGNKEAEDVISKTVTADECNHVLFLLPKGGLQVVPGQVYTIVLNSDHSVFGWKYVVDGYPKGAASLSGKPLSCETACTFLFRTFGTN